VGPRLTRALANLSCKLLCVADTSQRQDTMTASPGPDNRKPPRNSPSACDCQPHIKFVGYATHNSLQDKLASARVNLGPTPSTTSETPPSHQATPVDAIELNNHLPFNILLIYSHTVHHTGSRLAKHHSVFYIVYLNGFQLFVET
jgi:hypothetical protein